MKKEHRIDKTGWEFITTDNCPITPSPKEENKTRVREFRKFRGLPQKQVCSVISPFTINRLREIELGIGEDAGISEEDALELVLSVSVELLFPNSEIPL
jgi:hypothetical protein